MNIYKVMRSIFVAAVMGALSAPLYAEDLVWTGCGISKQAYMTELSQAFSHKTGIKILMTGGGASKGIRSVSAGQNALGGTCRHPLFGAGAVRTEEANAAVTQVAWDALVVITNKSNSVKNISSEQLKKVYMGEIKNWKELGGKDAPITLVDRENKESGVGYMLRIMLFKDPNINFPALANKGRHEKSTETLEELVERDPTALAVDGVSAAVKRNVNLLALDGVEPTKDNIANGKYSLFRPLYVVTDMHAPPKNAMQFVDFALSEEGQSIISKAGTVNLAEGKMLANMWDARKKELSIQVVQ